MIDPNYSLQPERRPPSPCVNICALDALGYCRGCYRTLQEIAAWSRMSAKDQWALVACLKGRRGAAGEASQRNLHHRET